MAQNSATIIILKVGIFVCMFVCMLVYMFTNFIRYCIAKLGIGTQRATGMIVGSLFGKQIKYGLFVGESVKMADAKLNVRCHRAHR